MYESYLKSDEVKNIIHGSAQCFGPIVMLRKICNHPDLISDSLNAPSPFRQNGKYTENDIDNYTSSDDDSVGLGIDESTLIERSGKLEVLAKILPLWKKQGHRVLIFSQWKKMLDIIQRFVIMNEWKFGRMDGNTNVASRQKMVDTFNNDDSYFAMLMTTKTGGVGLVSSF
jgi:DNA excision repair protein ERCC-6